MLLHRDYFSAANRPADFFMESFAEKKNGYYPLFTFEDMLATREDFENNDYSQELERVDCPSLVVRGGKSEYTRAELQEVAAKLKHGEFVEIPNAGHFVHYDQPEAWQVAVESFLTRISNVALK